MGLVLGHLRLIVDNSQMVPPADEHQPVQPLTDAEAIEELTVELASSRQRLDRRSALHVELATLQAELEVRQASAGS